jgi:hypothetical protein
MKSETEYLLRRAGEEAHKAISSEKPEAARVHEALSVHYSAKAVIQLLEEDEERDADERPKSAFFRAD